MQISQFQTLSGIKYLMPTDERLPGNFAILAYDNQFYWWETYRGSDLIAHYANAVKAVSALANVVLYDFDVKGKREEFDILTKHFRGLEEESYGMTEKENVHDFLNSIK